MSFTHKILLGVGLKSFALIYLTLNERGNFHTFLLEVRKCYCETNYTSIPNKLYSIAYEKDL